MENNENVARSLSSVPNVHKTSDVTSLRLDEEEEEEDDHSCGYRIFKCKSLQKFANPTAYIVIYGVTGCLISTCYAYFNGTISTLEKRFKMPSSSSGFISVGNDISQMISALTLTYFASRRHKPRWMGIGLLTIIAFCLLTATSHFVFGAGEEALALTREYGATMNISEKNSLIELQNSKHLCTSDASDEVECHENADNAQFYPKLILFAAHFLAGIGTSLYYTLGYSYMDDNAANNESPVMFSLAYFLNMLGPALGFNLASLCLRLYIAPTLEPVIDQSDPRWLGAWWLGWLILSIVLGCFAWLLSLFPKRLNNVSRVENQKAIHSDECKNYSLPEHEELIAENLKKEAITIQFEELVSTLKRLTTNKTYMCNNFSSVFYFFGFTAYWMFTPKYLEIQFHQTAAAASFITGNVMLLFCGCGVLLSGAMITRFQPSARTMVAWNVFVGFVTMLGMLAYSLIGCSPNENSIMTSIINNTCSLECHCEYTPYTPICGSADNLTYASPCHAGCKSIRMNEKGDQIYENCRCLLDERHANDMLIDAAFATPGTCPVDCSQKFLTFLIIMCLLKFIGSTGRASNFLISIRSVLPQDKSVAMGFGMFLMSVFTFIPSPIFFGWILDRSCWVWGKTCSSKGNCWLYDAKTLRYTLNITASGFVAIGTLLDCIVWRLSKKLKVFHSQEINNKDSTYELGSQT